MLLSIFDPIISAAGDAIIPSHDLSILEEFFSQELLFFQPEFFPVLVIAAGWFVVLGIMCYNLEKIPGIESNQLHR